MGKSKQNYKQAKGGRKKARQNAVQHNEPLDQEPSTSTEVI